MTLPVRIIAYATLLIYWGPSNALFYLWGFILFLIIAIYRKDWLKVQERFSKRIITYIMIFGLLFLISSLLNFLVYSTSINNLIWSAITYGSSFFSLLALLLIPFKSGDLLKVFKFAIFLTIFEVFLGYIQMLMFHGLTSLNPFQSGIDAGDFFVGTTFDPGIGNMVAIKVSLMTLVFVPIWFANKSLKNSVILALLFFGWVLASAIYTLLIGLIVLFYFFVLKKLWSALYTLRLNKSVLYITMVLILAVTMFVYTQRDNVTYMVESMKGVYGTVVNEEVGEVSRKILFYKETIAELPVEYPATIAIGVGPGNYSSRSAWLVSGQYLSNQPLYIPVTPSVVAQEFTLKLWSKDMIAAGFKGAGSITNQPFSSWLSVFAELGLFALVIFGSVFYQLHRAFKSIQKTPGDEFRSNIALGMSLSLAYIVLLFFVDNLFEWPLVMGQFFVFAAILIRTSLVGPTRSEAQNKS